MKKDQATLLPHGDVALISSHWMLMFVEGIIFGAIVLRHAANVHRSRKIRELGGSQDRFLSKIHGGLLGRWLPSLLGQAARDSRLDGYNQYVYCYPRMW